MNNLKYYDDSVAYDFDLFMPAEKREKKNNIVKMPSTVKQEASRRRSAASEVAGKFSAFLIVAFILAMLCGSIFLRSQITEVKTKIDGVNAKIAQMDSEAVRLNVELERKLSYNNLEEAAVAMGMRKMEKSQIVYIRTNTDNVVVPSDRELSAEHN